MSSFAVYTKIGCPYCTKVISALDLQSNNLWSINWAEILM